MIVYDSFDEALLGTARQFDKTFVVYDYEKVIEILMQDMSREDAEEYFEFNVVGGYVWESTPAFLLSKDEADAHNNRRH